jgi:hypothetical protein
VFSIQLLLKEPNVISLEEVDSFLSPIYCIPNRSCARN